jgi:hypothetical protein
MSLGAKMPILIQFTLSSTRFRKLDCIEGTLEITLKIFIRIYCCVNEILKILNICAHAQNK